MQLSHNTGLVICSERQRASSSCRDAAAPVRLQTMGEAADRKGTAAKRSAKSAAKTAKAEPKRIAEAEADRWRVRRNLHAEAIHARMRHGRIG